MVFFLTQPDGVGHIRLFVDRYGRDLGRDLVEMTYQQLLRRGSAPPGVYVFTDQQLMNPSQKRIAGWVREQLSRSPATHRVVNDPEKQLGRFQYIEALNAAGLSNFRIHRLKGLAPEYVRFPVFLRIEDDHMGPRSELLKTWDEMIRAAALLVLAGFAKDRIVVVEFIDTRCSDGLYRKYGAFRVGERIICQHVLHSAVWLSKRETTIRDPEMIDSSDRFYIENPHEQILMPYFELARIEYGRIDYAMLGDRPQVWEINDNPTFVTRKSGGLSKVPKGQRFVDAFAALAQDLIPGGEVELRLPLRAILNWMESN